MAERDTKGDSRPLNAPVVPSDALVWRRPLVYVAAAENDGSYPPEMAKRFETALALADVDYRMETYPAAHGWMMPDFPIYDHAGAARGWSAMLTLFGRNLHGDE